MRRTAISMTDPHTLIRLMSWLSPSFPTGAFSYSHGLETAADGLANEHDLYDWILALLENGSGWNDAVLLAHSWRQGACGDLTEVAELGFAMAGSRERHLETLNQGQAFLLAAKPWLNKNFETGAWPLPVAVGHVAALNNLELEATLIAFQHAFVSNQIQVALRLMPLGQSKAVALLQRFEEPILTIAKRAVISTLDNLGSGAIMAEIAAMKHETRHSRIFRT